MFSSILDFGFCCACAIAKEKLWGRLVAFSLAFWAVQIMGLVRMSNASLLNVLKGDDLRFMAQGIECHFEQGMNDAVGYSFSDRTQRGRGNVGHVGQGGAP